MKILICDDEQAVIEHFVKTIKCEFPGFSVLTAKNSTELLRIFNTEKNIDLFFADIMLGNENGISLASLAAEKYPEISIVFVSGNTDMVPLTFDTGKDARFIRKPIDDFYIKYHIEAVLKKLNSKKDIISFTIKNKLYRVNLSELVYIESKRNVVYFNKTNETLKFTAKLSDFEQFTTGKLVRCHQSFIVNIAFADTFTDNSLVMSTGAIIPVSRSRLPETKERFFMFKGGVI